jgi:CheY-like chemotaxis protein
VAPDGAQALDIYRRHHADIALVVLDPCMPGLSGRETFDALRALYPEVRCCFLTSSGDADELLERGDASVLQKPMEPDEIAGILRRTVAGP